MFFNGTKKKKNPNANEKKKKKTSYQTRLGTKIHELKIW
jgi:hypothetical protein